jgi:hypothetical protein
MTHRILIADPIDPIGLESSSPPAPRSTSCRRRGAAATRRAAARFDALVVRSMTKVTAELLAVVDRLR